MNLTDTVIIMSNEEVYSSYSQWASEYNLKNFKYEYGDKVDLVGMSGKIIAIGQHHIHHEYPVIGVKLSNDIDIIIDPRGVKIISSITLDNELFTM